MKESTRLTQGSAERDPLERALDEDDGVFPESWRPRVGSRIIGRLVRYSQGESKFGTRWIAVLEALNDAGVPYLVSVWLSHTVLVEQFKKLRPKPGERVGIKRVADSEKGYARYVVKIERNGAVEVPDWDRLGKELDTDPALAHGATGGDDSEDLPF